jgi:hypothetical protein
LQIDAIAKYCTVVFVNGQPQVDDAGNTALHYAAKRLDEAALAILTGATPLHWRGIRIVRAVLYALGAGSKTLVRHVIEGALPDPRGGHDSAAPSTKRREADTLAREKCLRLLLGLDPGLASYCGKDGYTPAWLAARGGDAAILHILHAADPSSVWVESGWVCKSYVCSTHTTTSPAKQLPVHAAASGGHLDCLRFLGDSDLQTHEKLGLADVDGLTCVHYAARHPAALRLLHELGVDMHAVTNPGDYDRSGWSSRQFAVRSVAHFAASHGMCHVFRGVKPEHDATPANCAESLAVLHELGVSLTTNHEDGRTPAHIAALYGRADTLETLHLLGAGATLSALEAKRGRTPVHLCAGTKCSDEESYACIQALCKLGASATLSMQDDYGNCPAHYLTLANKPKSLRVVLEHGHEATFSILNNDGNNCTLLACAPAREEREDACVQVFADAGVARDFMIHNLGPMLMKEPPSQSAVGSAAMKAHTTTLRILHAGICSVVDPALAMLAVQFPNRPHALGLIQELQAERSLSLSDGPGSTLFAKYTPAGYASAAAEELCSHGFRGDDDPILEDDDCRQFGRNLKRAAYLECLLFLREVGGMAPLWSLLAQRPEQLLSLQCLLTDPRLLSFAAKQAWLQLQLTELIDDADAVALQLVASRERYASLNCVGIACRPAASLTRCNPRSILDGLCGAFGVHEHDGSLEGPNTLPRSIDVTFQDESGAGDGLRREFFAQVRSVPPEQIRRFGPFTRPACTPMASRLRLWF